jgi:homogentisate 1,2-dioxygenase
MTVFIILKEEGFRPGGASLHSMMTPHGPDSGCFAKASTEKLEPIKVAVGTQSFMFETSLGLNTTKWSKHICKKVDDEYYKCWHSLKDNFNPDEKQ